MTAVRQREISEEIWQAKHHQGQCEKLDVHYISDRTAGGHVGVTDDRKSGVKTGLNVAAVG